MKVTWTSATVYGYPGRRTMSSPSRAKRHSTSGRADYDREHRRSRSRSRDRHGRGREDRTRRSRDRSRERYRTRQSRDRSPLKRIEASESSRCSTDGDVLRGLPVRAATNVDDRSMSLLAAFQARAGERAAPTSATTSHMIAAYASGARMMESSISATADSDKPRLLTDRPPDAPRFKCVVCRFQCHYETFGRVWRPMPVLEFVENVYMLRDPLRASSATGVLWPLVIGAKCAQCNSDVCMSKGCSAFVSQRRACATCSGNPSTKQLEERLD